MDWDMLLVTGALIGVFMLIALLGRIIKRRAGGRCHRKIPLFQCLYGAPQPRVTNWAAGCGS